MTTITSPKYVDTEYVATYLGVKVTAVNRNCREGKLPAVKFGHRWYINKERFDRMFDPVPQVSSPDQAQGAASSDGPAGGDQLEEGQR